MKLSDFLALEVSQATDSQARIVLRDQSAGQLASYQGKLRGPDCRYARTLPSSFPVKQTVARETRELLVTEPCYWSPHLPLLYRFELEVTLKSGELYSLRQEFGLRRWETFGASLRLEGRRVVLRGGSLSLDGAEALQAARESAAAVIVVDPSAELLAAASAAGVNVVADLRDCQGLPEKLRALAWEPAATFAVFDFSDPDGNQSSTDIKRVQALNCDSRASGLSASASAVLVELRETERPPSWLADCGRPVLVRRDAARLEAFAQVRIACDRLQAELAPEFDFAGYFVG